MSSKQRVVTCNRFVPLLPRGPKQQPRLKRFDTAAITAADSAAAKTEHAGEGGDIDSGRRSETAGSCRDLQRPDTTSRSCRTDACEANSGSCRGTCGRSSVTRGPWKSDLDSAGRQGSHATRIGSGGNCRGAADADVLGGGKDCGYCSHAGCEGCGESGRDAANPEKPNGGGGGGHGSDAETAVDRGGSSDAACPEKLRGDGGGGHGWLLAKTAPLVSSAPSDSSSVLSWKA